MTTADKTTLQHYSMETAQDFVGRELGVSDWVTVDQDRINQFRPAPAIDNGSTSMSIVRGVRARSAGRSRTAISRCRWSPQR